jgi:hypothetical protein
MFEKARAQMKCKLASVAYTGTMIYVYEPSGCISILNHHHHIRVSFHSARFSNSLSTKPNIIFSSIIWQQFIKYRISRGGGGVFLSNALPRTDDVRRARRPTTNQLIIPFHLVESLIGVINYLSRSGSAYRLFE